MIHFFEKLFGGAKPSVKELLENGALIIDVRTPGEYRSGHIKGSVNIPLNTLNARLPELKKTNSIITCCASGMRSASAKSILKANGFTDVHNGGGWMSLQEKIRK